jgi:hypothetical protein
LLRCLGSRKASRSPRRRYEAVRASIRPHEPLARHPVTSDVRPDGRCAMASTPADHLPESSTSTTRRRHREACQTGHRIAPPQHGCPARCRNRRAHEAHARVHRGDAFSCVRAARKRVTQGCFDANAANVADRLLSACRGPIRTSCGRPSNASERVGRSGTRAARVSRSRRACVGRTASGEILAGVDGSRGAGGPRSEWAVPSHRIGERHRVDAVVHLPGRAELDVRARPVGRAGPPDLWLTGSRPCERHFVTEGAETRVERRRVVPERPE